MKKLTILGTSFLLAAATLAAVPASAAPLGSLKSGISTDTSVVQVGWRCGPRRHWSPRWGRCVWN